MNALRRYSESQTDKQNNAIQHRGNEGIDDTDEAIELSSGVTKDSPCSDPNEKNGRRGKAIDIPFRFVFVDEPLALWNSLCNDDGRNLLETYYSGEKMSSVGGEVAIEFITLIMSEVKLRCHFGDISFRVTHRLSANQTQSFMLSFIHSNTLT